MIQTIEPNNTNFGRETLNHLPWNNPIKSDEIANTTIFPLLILPLIILFTKTRTPLNKNDNI